MRGIPRWAVKGNKPIADSPYHAADAVLPESNRQRVCEWCADMFGVDGDSPAGQAWYRSIARQYAEWGVDYIKADDMSSLGAASPDGLHFAAAEIAALSAGLRGSGRSIELSLSPGDTPLVAARHVARWANLWRITGDFWDNWGALDRTLGVFESWFASGVCGPGHWADGDMLPLGVLSLGGQPVGPERTTRFTPSEQVTLLTAWCMAPSALMIGACLPRADAWTTALLTNPEVLAVQCDPLGRGAHRLAGVPGNAAVWVRELADGDLAVAVISRGGAAKVSVPPSWLGLSGKMVARDLWRRADLGACDRLELEVAGHGAGLWRVRGAAAGN
jgi:hypothetical protein